MKPLMQLRNLTTVYPTKRGVVRAVDSINLTVQPGGVLGLVGSPVVEKVLSCSRSWA
jgi:ABC-type oligopeptide transport system ATPase subunit